MTAVPITFNRFFFSILVFCIVAAVVHLIWKKFLRPWLEERGDLYPLAENEAIPLTVWPGVFLIVSLLGFLLWAGDAAGY